MTGNTSSISSESYNQWLTRPETQWYLSVLKTRLETLEVGWSSGRLGMVDDKLDPDALIQQTLTACVVRELLTLASDYDSMVELGELEV